MKPFSDSINVLILDDQHRVLFDNIERLKQAMLGGQAAAEVPLLLLNLVRFADYHFPTEERLMDTYKYPLRDIHAIEHRVLGMHLRKMSHLIRHDDKTVALQLMDLLTHWLENHIRTWDARLGEYLNAYGVE